MLYVTDEPVLVVERLAMLWHDVLSTVQVPLAALALKLPAPPTETVTAELVTVVTPPVPPTVMTRLAETLATVKTARHVPLPFGVIV